MAAQDGSAAPAYVYLLYGEDEFARSEQLAALRQKMAQREAGEYNITTLDGESASVAEVIAACEAAPFLADRRMVIVKGLLGRLAGRPARRSGRGKGQAGEDDGQLERLLGALRGLPPTTAVVLVEGPLEETLVARLRGPRTVVRRFDRPRGERLAEWLMKRARSQGVELRPDAARALAAESEDPRLLDAELSKLALYCQGPIDLEAVRLLAASGETSIFALLDAVAERRMGDALAALRDLFQHGHRPEMVMGQLASLIRRLLVVKELSRSGPPSASQAAAHGINPATLPRLARQARALSVEELERALERLLEADRASKSGALEAELAVELAVAELSARR